MSLKIAGGVLLLLATVTGLIVVATGEQSYQVSEVAELENSDPAHDIKRQDSRFRLESFQLENGLRVVAIPFPDAKTTTLMVWYKVGSADDPPDKPGLAHFVEHVTFGATGGPEKTPDFVNNGDSHDGMSGVEAFTSYDSTAYYHVVPRGRLEAVAIVEAARMSDLSLPEESLDNERGEILDERLHDIDEDPEALLEEQTRAVLWAKTAYAHPVVADPAGTNQVSEQDIRQFYEIWYVPNNAVLVASGNIVPSDLRALAQKYFGKIPKRSIPRRHRSKPVLRKSERRVVLKSASARETLWIRAYIAPSVAKTGTGLVAATQVMAELLSANSMGYLHRSLVEEQKLAKDIGVDYSGNAVGYTTLTIHAALSAGTDISDFEAVLDNELKKLVSEKATRQDVISARDRVRAALSDIWNDPFEAANVVGAALAAGRSIEDVMAWEEKVRAVSPNRVRDAAQHIFTTGNGVTGILRPE